jgi:hypothetical protein
MTTAKETAPPALEPTSSGEAARVERLSKRMKEKPRGPDMRLRKAEDGALTVAFQHEDPDMGALLLMADMGTTELPFFLGLSGQIASLGSHKRQVDEDASNFALSVIRGVEPRDQMEAMLAAQMAAVHMATMMLARRLNHVETLQQQDGAERAFNKLARTFAMQMEALKRYRTGGTQKVTVEHVTVNAGGQAIVGTVTRGEGA